MTTNTNTNTNTNTATNTTDTASKPDHVWRMTPGDAWDTFVGGQSTSEFEELCDGEPIEQAVERYLAETREQWGMEMEAEAHVARLLVRHIEANRAD